MTAPSQVVPNPRISAGSTVDVTGPALALTSEVISTFQMSRAPQRLHCTDRPARRLAGQADAVHRSGEAAKLEAAQNRVPMRRP